jgi:two-component system NtrC family response regulator
MNAKILVVDDEPEICEVISHYLGKKNYEVITATSAKEAMAKFSSEKPALILLDIRMPDMDGVECLKELKKMNKDIPVIMVSAVTDLDKAKETMKLGATDYLAKPIGFEALEMAISTYLFLGSVK